MESSNSKGKPNPRANANPLSVSLMWWVRKIFWKSYKEGLTEEDLFDVLNDDKANVVGDLLEKKWNEEIQRARKAKKKPSFMHAVIRAFGPRYVAFSLIAVIEHVVVSVALPLLLGKVVQYFTGNSGLSKREGYMYAVSMVVLVFLKAFLYHHFLLQCKYAGMRVRVACCTLLYQKVLRHSKYTLDHSTIGKAVNLMSNDVGRFDTSALFLHRLWLGIIQIPVVTYYMWRVVEYSSLVGFSFIVLCTVPVQGYFGKLTTSLCKATANKTDQRMKLMNEILSGIRIIKMYAWEKPFEDLVSMIRNKEIDLLTKTAYIRSYYLSSIIFMERASLFITLMTYSLFGNVVFPFQVFILAQYFNTLNLTLAVFYPMGVLYAAECYVSLGRIEEFLLQEEAQIEPKYLAPSQCYVTINSGYAKWTGGCYVLKNISVCVSQASCFAIIGPVGSGKSSLLQVILKELPLERGSVTVCGRISYSSQEPWIFSGTLRQNILFGEPYIADKYHEVIKVCALERDFQLLPHRDHTIIGEKGINLSGGQRARINLARAVYREADIYIMDDPLSAVDTHVGKYILEMCIEGYLKGKTRILVTHQLQYLEKFENIIFLNNGVIESQGSGMDIMLSGLVYAKFISTTDGKDHRVEPGHDYKDFSRRFPEAIHERLSSHAGCEELPPQQDEHDEKLTTSFAWKAYWRYIRASNSICMLSLLVAMLLVSQVVTSGADYWVSFWSAAEVSRLYSVDKNPNMWTRDFFLVVYGGIIVTLIVSVLFRSVIFFRLSMKSSKNLHDAMLHCTLRGVMRFFDVNPVGRLLNRFSKDVGAMDDLLPPCFLMMTQIYLIIVGIVVMIIMMNYYLIIPVVIMGAVLACLSRAFVGAARNIKHLEGIKRSPLFSRLSDTINGLTTIRAAGAQSILSKEFDTYQDRHTSNWFIMSSVNTALGFWLDLLCSLFVALVTFSFLLFGKERFPGADVGLAISQALLLTGMVQHGILQMVEVVSQMTSVERVLEYTKMESEPPLESEPDNKPADDWPQKAVVQFKDISLWYNDTDPPVLKNVNFTIQQCQKVGVVGRTGAGKSSLLAALFRLAKTEGSVLIDGVDIASIGLHDLRRRICIIPQEPVLFSKSIRCNLDPFQEFQDDVLWNVLEEVEMKAAVKSLDWEISGGGNNLSMGQRQLICLARAILRNCRLLVLDEATANVDPETDRLIQRTIRRKFKDSTVLTIAHRLNTIMDSNLVVVMDSGRLVEIDHPHVLLQNRNSKFSELVRETSKSMEEMLRTIAEQAFETMTGNHSLKDETTRC